MTPVCLSAGCPASWASPHYGALRQRGRRLLSYDIRSIAVGRLDEPIPITVAIETVALSWSSFYIRLDLYAPLGN